MVTWYKADVALKNIIFEPFDESEEDPIRWVMGQRKIPYICRDKGGKVKGKSKLLPA